MKKVVGQSNLFRISFLVLFLAFTLILFSINFVSAQENTQNIQEETTIPSTTSSTTPEETRDSDAADSTTASSNDLDNSQEDRETQQEEIQLEDEENKDAKLSVGAGITPDSGFYFVEDQILSRFRDDLGNREKKIAEIREMVNEGNIDAARKSLEKYRRYADNLENEIDPAKREEAKRSAAAIRNTLREIENEIPENERKEFVNDVLDKEKSIVTAVEIAGKIKELCESLSKLDPLEYSKVCRIEGDAPDWQKKLDKKLTKEQRDEAEKFGKIMSECFKTSGQQCRCDEIPFTDFAEACSTAAPLATACEIREDEKACEELDNLEMPELPPHLQDVFDRLEEGISGARMDLHMPRECVEAKATSPKECFKIMFKVNAPEECVAALDRGEIKVDNEREARKACEEIMFKANAPEECVAAGVKDPKECGKIMFKVNAPEECVAAGLTGESRSDEKKCREIMESQGREGRDRRGLPRGFGPDCRSIQNSEERLKCYDGALSGVEEHFEDKNNFNERFKEIKERERECADSCSQKGGRWDFTGGQCRCYTDENRNDFQDRGDFERREDFMPPQEGQQPPQGFEGQQPPSTESGSATSPSTESSGTTSGGSEITSGTTTSSGSSGETSSGTTASSGGEGAVTGSVTGKIIAGNNFLEYYFG